MGIAELIVKKEEIMKKNLSRLSNYCRDRGITLQLVGFDETELFFVAHGEVKNLAYLTTLVVSDNPGYTINLTRKE